MLLDPAISTLVFGRRRSCQILVMFKIYVSLFMRCNRKTAGLAVTPLRKITFDR
jgi:hypothetical protein